MTLFPQNGRVLVIDDELIQVKPLLNILSRNRVKYSYFSGELSEIPPDGLDDIRILFLDLNLQKSGDNSAQLNKIFSVIKPIINKKNGLYIIILWSKNAGDPLAKNFKEKLSAEQDIPQPLDIIDLNKLDFFDLNADDSLKIQEGKTLEGTLTEIFDRISENVPPDHFFHVYTHWDNIINKSSNEIINSVSKLDDDKEINNKKNWSLLYDLAKARIGRNDVTSDDQIVLNSLLTFNSAFFDTVESNLTRLTYPLPVLPKEDLIPIDITDKAKINKKILTSVDDLKCEPGAVYFETNDPKEKIQGSIISDAINREKVCQEFCDSIPKKWADVFKPDGKPQDGFKKPVGKYLDDKRNEIKRNSKLIFCEVTPSCDYAQKKHKLNRVIFGILWPEQFSNYILNHSNYLYKSSVIDIDGKQYAIVFDFRFFHSKREDDFEGISPFLRLRHEILVDIQSHLAAHVHRPGITAL